MVNRSLNGPGVSIPSAQVGPNAYFLVGAETYVCPGSWPKTELRAKEIIVSRKLLTELCIPAASIAGSAAYKTQSPSVF